jgi:DNA-binding CsgD family transcriptional regulator
MLDSVRRGQYRLATALELDPAAASSPEDVEVAERACDLSQLMVGLTDRETRILQLCYWQGMSSREAAVPMGLNPRQARRLYQHTMRKLRMAARADFGGSGDYTSVSVPKKEPKTPQARVIALLVDELGALREEIAAREKRESEIIKQIRVQADIDAKPETSIVFEGRMYSALVSAHGSRQKVSDKPKVFEILGRAGFFEHCTFSVEKAEKLLTEEQFNAVVTVDEFCSPRKVDSAARAALTQKKAA